jgi:hypothetical protein
MMDFEKFLNVQCEIFGDVITLLTLELCEEYGFENILFIRTTTTGGWLDNILPNNNRIARIMYYTDKVNYPTKIHPSTIVVHSNQLEHAMKSFQKKFDLICIDTWHEHDISLRDFELIYMLLSENGLCLSHDCYPWNRQVASKKFVQGLWCGETYISFTEFAYKHPELYYLILKIDTGIGIISKRYINGMSNKLDRSKQLSLLYLFRYNKDYYSYFLNNSRDMVNAL